MIRHLVAADAAIYKDIRLESVKAYESAFFGSFEEESKSTDEHWANHLAKNVLYGFFEGDTLAGIAGYFQMQVKKRLHRATLYAVYVRPAFRKKRIMDKLIAAILDHARKNGVEQMNLGVSVENKSAIACYERCGFKAYGTDPRSIKWEGAYVDELMMMRYL